MSLIVSHFNSIKESKEIEYFIVAMQIYLNNMVLLDSWFIMHDFYVDDLVVKSQYLQLRKVHA